MTKTVELSADAKAVFLAIAAGNLPDCSVTGPKRGAQVGALKKKGLVLDSSKLSAAGQRLHAEITGTATEKKAKADKPRHNERTLGHIAVVRSTLGDKVAGKTDDEIGSAIWRVATPEKAIEKACEVFKIAA